MGVVPDARCRDFLGTRRRHEALAGTVRVAGAGVTQAQSASDVARTAWSAAAMRLAALERLDERGREADRLARLAADQRTAEESASGRTATAGEDRVSVETFGPAAVQARIAEIQGRFVSAPLATPCPPAARPAPARSVAAPAVVPQPASPRGAQRPAGRAPVTSRRRSPGWQESAATTGDPRRPRAASLR